MVTGQIGIYRIKNTTTGVSYIGSSVDINGRFRMHVSLLSRNRHTNIHLQRSWNKHGCEAFVFEVIEACCSKNLLAREQFYLDSEQETYNIAKHAGAPTRGRTASLEERRRQSELYKKLGIRPPNHLGMKRSPETCKKIGLNNKGRKFSAEWRANLSKAHAGKPRNKEAVLKTAAANTGKKRTEETKQKMREAWVRRRSGKVPVESGVPLTLTES